MSCEVQLLPYTLPFLRPIRTAKTLAIHRTGFCLRLRFAHGVAGHGEAAGWPGFGSGSEAIAAAAPAVLHTLQAAAARLAPLPTQTAEAARAWLGEAAAVIDPLWPCEWRHAVECALYDAAGQAVGLPVAALLADSFITQVPVHVQIDSAVAARQAVQDGARAIKMKIGQRTMDDDGARVAGVRAAIGDKVDLRLDANGVWPAPVAQRAANMLATVAPQWLEQPVAAHDIAGMAALRRSRAMPIAVDEGVWDAATLQAHIDADAIDVVVLKPMFLGGLRTALALARTAQQAGIKVCITHAFESRLGCRAAQHLAAAVNDTAAGLRPALLQPQAQEPLPMALWPLPAEAGLGVQPGELPA